MAVTTTRTRFEDFQVSIAGADIEGLTSAELVLTQNLPQTGSAAPSSDVSYCRGIRSGTLNLAGSFIDADTLPKCGLGATLSLDNGVADFKGLGDVTINATQEVGDVTTQSSSGAREVEPGKRTCSVDLNGVYFDPLGAGANNSEMITDAISGNQTIDVLVDWPTGSSFRMATAYTENVSITRTEDEAVVQIAGTLRGSGAPTATYDADTTLDSLLQSVHTAASLSYKMVVAASGTPVVGATSYTFSGYCTALTINIPLEEQITWTATVEINGAVTEGAHA